MVSEAHCMSFPCTELLLFNYTKVKTVFHSMALLKEYLSLLPSPWKPTTAQINSPHILYLVILKKFQFGLSFFYPCISMATAHSCRARWRIAAAHNLCILIDRIDQIFTIHYPN